jgi:hypothetical protein
MKGQGKGNGTVANRRISPHLRATFGVIDMRVIRNRGLIALGIVSLLITGAASADWRVRDQTLISLMEQIRDDYIGNTDGTVTHHLNDINDRLVIGGDDFTAGGDRDDQAFEPQQEDDKLPADKARPTAAADVDLSKRCPASGLASLTGVAKEQNTVCVEMYRTEIAKYRFSLEMYELAQTRNQKLQEIIEERNALTEEDFGKMEENTNKLVALTAQMDNDRDRYSAYMNAYDARTAHLQKASDVLGRAAISGGPVTPESIGASLIGAGVLAVALRTAAETEERDCTARMRNAGIC